jgi:hypothetical protein
MYITVEFSKKCEGISNNWVCGVIHLVRYFEGQDGLLREKLT